MDVTSDDQPKVAAGYGSNHLRAREVKGRHDPGNVCHLDQNTQPGG